MVRLKGSSAILTGRIFDDRGNRMSPTHSNKLGVRYRYYVSQALMQKRKAEAGSVARVPAPEIEALVLDGVRKHLALPEQESTSIADRDLIEGYVERVVVKPQALELCLLPREVSVPGEETNTSDSDTGPITTKLTLAWTAASFTGVKGIVHTPCATPTMKPSSRDALLAAIAKARSWIEDIRLGRVAALAEIAEREGQVERHIRLLAPLAFLSPRIIAVIFDGTAPADLTVTGLAKALPYSWAEQEQSIAGVGDNNGRAAV
jgi:site-specific DNA recombinase